MAYSASALSVAIKSSLDANVAAMQAAIAAGESSTMLQDFCDTVAAAIVDHLNAHPVTVVIPPGSVLVAATGGVPNPTPISCTASVS